MRNRFLFFTALIGVMLFVACDEKESDLGVNLQDPATLYNGICDTAYGTAYTVYDDSLLTSGQASVLIGCYSDNLFGTSEAVFFSKITTANDGGVEFDQNSIIDSAVLTMTVSSIFPEINSKSYRDLHFEVYQLSEPVLRDSAYYAFDELPVTSVCFFDDVVRLAQSDSMVVSMRMSDAFVNMLSNHRYESSTAFEEVMKGVRIRLVNDGTPVMVTVNLAAVATKLTTYYKYVNSGDTIARTYDFVISQAAPHFNQFKNNYAGVLSAFNSNVSDSLDGSRYLYLSPMGGTNIKVNFNSFVQQFRQQHPYAVIHYAELLLPVADIAPDSKPDLIAAFKCYNDGAVSSIPDMFDAFTASGYDGHYSDESNCYRLRITQHFQKTMKSGMDLGTLLVLNGRRSSAMHTVINGCDAALTAGNPIRIQFVYSE
jgi:hypothetical protein